jgi:2-dehydropantoate 2-reductase
LRGGRDPLRVLVAGAGAIGQWLGLRLMQAGHEVTLLARPRHAQAMRQDGLRVRGHSELHAHPAVATETEGLPSFDAIVVTAKAHQTQALVADVAPLLHEGGFLATLQNGFGNAQKLLARVPARQVAVALTSHGVTIESPGVIHHAGLGSTVVGPWTLEGEAAARRLHGLLDHAGLQPEWSDAMRGHVWRKALANHAINPLGALHGCANGGLLRGPAWTQVQQLVEEGYAISRCAGVGLPGVGDASGLLDAVRGTLERTAANRNSMLQDVESKRPTEVEQISGRLVRLARRLGIAAPHSDEVYRNLKALESRYLGEEALLQRVRDEAHWETEMP